MKKRISLLLAAALLAGTLSGCSGTNPIDWVKQKFRDVTGVSEEATADPTETASADNAAPDPSRWTPRSPTSLSATALPIRRNTDSIRTTA